MHFIPALLVLSGLLVSTLIHKGMDACDRSDCLVLLAFIRIHLAIWGVVLFLLTVYGVAAQWML